MNYEFALDKKALVSLIAGSVAIAVLLFLAGWIVGRQWTGVASAEAASMTTDDERALPKEPVLREGVSAPNSDTPKSAKPKVPLPSQPPAPPTAEAAQPAAAPLVTDAQVTIISEDDAGAANKETEAAAEPQYVTVQVGVFLDEKDASHLLKQMEQKGYAPTFFSGRDAEARQWYAVRVGTYTDKQQASNAAANLTKQENIRAVVRPLHSL
jgi:septal ring-binding cell division protein DamX